jgi:hypothetical protein
MLEVTESTSQERQVIAGRWVTAKAYAEIHGIATQTLANWRHQDLKAGRSRAAPGFPQYKRFGTAVRYLLKAEAA